MLKYHTILVAAVMCLGLLVPSSVQQPIDSDSSTVVYLKRSPGGNSIDKYNNIDGDWIKEKYEQARPNSREELKWKSRKEAFESTDPSLSSDIAGEYEMKHRKGRKTNREAHIEAWNKLATKKYQASQAVTKASSSKKGGK